MLGLSPGGTPGFAVSVRKPVWIIFCAALLLALALPTATVLHQRWAESAGHRHGLAGPAAGRRRCRISSFPLPIPVIRRR